MSARQTRRPERRGVVFLCDYQAPYGGNFIVSLLALEARLGEAGIACAYLFPSGAEKQPWFMTLRSQGRALETFDESAGYIRNARRVRAVCRQYGAGILHVHFSRHALSWYAGLLDPKLLLVWHYHSDFSLGRAAGAKQKLKRLALRTAGTLLGERRIRRIVVGRHLLGAYPGSVCIENGLVPARLCARGPGRAETRQRLGLTDDDTLVLLFGWSPRVKGVDTAVRAVARLQGGTGRTVLGLVGGRSMPPDRMACFISQNTPYAGNEDWIRHLPPEEDVFMYHEASDILLSASRSEAFSFGLLEGLYAGRVCVSTDIPGVQWARAYESVLFAPPADDAALSGVLAQAAALSHTDGYRDTLAHVSARVAKEYAIDRWVDDVMREYGLPVQELRV